MEYVIELSLSNSAFYYRLFFVLAFALSYAIIIYQLWRNNKLNSAYLTAIAFVSLAFVIGCKLVPFLDFYFSPPLGSNTITLGQMTLGGIVMGLIALIGVVRYLRLSKDLLYYYVLASLASLALQKVGCLFAGCCYGHSLGIIQISYVPGINHNALPVYQIIGYITIMILLIQLKRRGFKSATICYMSLLSYSVIQFIVEFDKLEAQTLAFSELFYGLKVLQWIYVFVLFWAIIGIYSNARNEISSKNSRNLSNYSMLRTFILFFVTILILLASKNYLYKTEVIAVNIALLPALAYIAMRAYQKVLIPKYRLVSLLLCVVPLFLMSQTVVDNDSAKRYSYHSLGFGVKTGDAHNRIVVSTSSPGSCGGTSYQRTFNHSYFLGGVGYSHTKVEIQEKKKYNKVELGINASFGKHTESYDDIISNSTDYPIFDINPVVKLDSRWIGFNFGAHYGNVSQFLIDDYRQGSGVPKTGLNSTKLIPQFSIRVGPSDIIFIEYNYANKFISPLPDIPQDIALGTGLGFTNGFNIRLGATLSSVESSYVSAYIPIKNKIVIEPLLRFGNGNSYMIGANYRFGKGTWVKKVH